MKATEIYAQTGEVIERDFTKAELEQRKKDEKEYATAEAIKQAEAEAKEIAKAAILDRLGLTADELKTILG
jgi:hypothetical protein